MPRRRGLPKDYGERSVIAGKVGALVFNSSAALLVAGQVRFGYQVSKAGVNALTRFIAACPLCGPRRFPLTIHFVD